MDNPLIALSHAAAGWRDAELDPRVAHDARRAVLDWVAALLPGCLDGPAIPLARVLSASRGTGAAISYVDGATCSARDAALLNGTASHTAEFDDIFRDGGYHPGSPTISAALAVAQAEGRSFDDFLRAVIGGYELGCRIAIALQPSHYEHWHITATVGTFGAAASAAMLLDCEAEGIAQAVAIATSFAGGHQENLQGAGLTKALHSGHAAEAGVLAAYAAAGGITGSPGSLHAPHGYAAATSAGTGDWAAALDGLGEWTPISVMTFKNHGCCGHIFPALDGLRTLREEVGFDAADVREVEVSGYGPTAAICDRPQVGSARDARFSVQYCVSALLHLGEVRLSAFTDAALARADIRAFMPRVSVREDPAIAALYPRRRQARLRVTLRDGRVLEHHQTTRKGDPDDPLSDAELVAKFHELAAPALPRPAREALLESILTGTRLPGAIPLGRETQLA